MNKARLLRGICVPLISWLCTFAIADVNAEPLRLTGLDIASMSSASGVTLSPDGKRVAYVRTARIFDEEAEFAEDDDRGGWTVEEQIWIVDTSSLSVRQLTFGEEKASQPRFSPDGNHLAFIRKQDGRARLHVLDLSGGEARPVDTGEVEPGRYAWSPDGEQFAFVAEAPPTNEEKDRNWASGGAINWANQWRNKFLWIVPAEGGEPRRLTADDLNIVRFVWSPDGTKFLVATSVSSDPYHEICLLTPRILSVADGTVVKTLLTKPEMIEELAWSPNGRLVAFAFSDEGWSLINSLMVHEVDSDDFWNAAASLDPTLGGFFFAEDSKSLIAHVIERTDSSLYRLSIDGAHAERIGQPDRVLSGPLVPSQDRQLFVTTSSTTREPLDPTVITLDGQKVEVVVRLNPQVENWGLGEQEIVSWKSPEGPTIEGILFHSPLHSKDEPGPLLVFPHGGPDSVTTKRFQPWAHYFAARGLTVLRPNYRGGIGYGLEFYAANRGRLGTIEFMDIEAGVDRLIADGIADPDQLFYGGWSFGGYITSWTIGHTDRYQAAVAGAAVVDTVGSFVMSDIDHGVTAEWYYRTTVWGNFGPIDSVNPMRYLHQVTTPTLIIHGQSDVRVPFPQGVTLYRALSDIGIEVEMYAYPGEPHSFTQPAHTRHMLDAWAAWYESHGLEN